MTRSRPDLHRLRRRGTTAQALRRVAPQLGKAVSAAANGLYTEGGTGSTPRSAKRRELRRPDE